MKAIVYTEYGSPDVLHMQETAKPEPKDNEICVRIHATPVSTGDLMARNFSSISPRKFSMPFIFWLPARLAFGISKPQKNILGSEFAGVVASTGKAVTAFKPGDRVFGYRGPAFGAYAEYLCMPQDGLVAHTPASFTDEQAAVVSYGALTALNLLKKADIQPGQKVLIFGASGGIGSAALQLAKHFGAEVTGVCSTPRLAYVKSLGADHVIDYTREDFTRNGKTYDLILDVLGKGSFARFKDSLTPQGTYLLASFKMKQVFQMLWTSKGSGKKVICALSMETPVDLLFITELMEAGELKAIVDRTFPLEQAADAHRYAESGQKQGSVVITVEKS